MSRKNEWRTDGRVLAIGGGTELHHQGYGDTAHVLGSPRIPWTSSQCGIVAERLNGSKWHGSRVMWEAEKLRHSGIHLQRQGGLYIGELWLGVHKNVLCGQCHNRSQASQKGLSTSLWQTACCVSVVVGTRLRTLYELSPIFSIFSFTYLCFWERVLLGRPGWPSASFVTGWHLCAPACHCFSFVCFFC